MEEILEWVLRLLQVGKLVASGGKAWQKFISKVRRSSSSNEQYITWLLSLNGILSDRVLILLILYRCQDSASSLDDLLRRTNYGDLNMFQENVLNELHDNRLVRFDREASRVVLLNRGRKYLEEKILKQLKLQFATLQHGNT